MLYTLYVVLQTMQPMWVLCLTAGLVLVTLSCVLARTFSSSYQDIFSVVIEHALFVHCLLGILNTQKTAE